MKPITRYNKAMKIENLQLRMMKLYTVAFTARPYSEAWNLASAEIDRLHAAGIKMVTEAEAAHAAEYIPTLPAWYTGE